MFLFYRNPGEKTSAFRGGTFTQKRRRNNKNGYTMGKQGDEWAMPNIKPISDLRNYSEVLHEVTVGTPVFLTKNGRGKYAILDIQDYEKTQATLQLISELNKGRKSGEKEGWVSSGELRGHFQRKADEK